MKGALYIHNVDSERCSVLCASGSVIDIMYTTPVGLGPGTVAATHLNRLEQLSEESSPFQSFTLPSDSGLIFSGYAWLMIFMTNMVTLIGRIDREQIRSRINNNDCRTFRPRPAIIVIDSATYLLTISSPGINKVAMSLYDIMVTLGMQVYVRALRPHVG